MAEAKKSGGGGGYGPPAPPPPKTTTDLSTFRNFNQDLNYYSFTLDVIVHV